ncbi:hypothetical protein RUND412_008345 [Rhizina undulata]
MPPRQLLKLAPRGILAPTRLFSTTAHPLNENDISGSGFGSPLPNTPRRGSGISLTGPSTRQTTTLRNTTEGLQSVMQSAMQRQNSNSILNDLGDAGEQVSVSDLLQNQYRFQLGETYAPHHLSFQEFRKRTKRQKPSRDAFDLLGMNPLDDYKNFNMLAEYVTDMGRIKHRNDTGLRPVNQRRIAKAIRRGVGIGLLPSTHKHPEILKQIEDRRRSSQNRR